ncbi:MAG TPA: hypothetical protein VMX57_08425, partial [Planctomycetota bacterium]|nr:hypothetical protein [Planctomycetota bacterium]
MHTLATDFLESLATPEAIIVVVAVALLGAAAGYLLFRWAAVRKGEHAAQRAEEVIAEARQ